MIEVYRTNVQTLQQAGRVTGSLQQCFSGTTINFDLDDHDRILRVEGIAPDEVIMVKKELNQLGFVCEILN